VLGLLYYEDIRELMRKSFFCTSGRQKASINQKGIYGKITVGIDG